MMERREGGQTEGEVKGRGWGREWEWEETGMGKEEGEPCSHMCDHACRKSKISKDVKNLGWRLTRVLFFLPFTHLNLFFLWF